MKICRECEREHSRRGTLCGTCAINLRRFRIRKKIMEYFGEAKCQRCGYNACYGALNVHHLDPRQKKFALSGAHCRSWASIEAELEKCILICANCHMEEHHNCERYECTTAGSQMVKAPIL